MDVWTLFFIPVRGSNHRNHIHGTRIPSSDIISAQLTAVCICLEALRRICYDVPDFSHFKALALNTGDIPVPQASEWFASYNHADVVKWSLIPKSGYLLFIIVITFSNFFYFSLHADCTPGPYLCYIWLVGRSRPKYGATRVWLGLLQCKPRPAH